LGLTGLSAQRPALPRPQLALAAAHRARAVRTSGTVPSPRLRGGRGTRGTVRVRIRLRVPDIPGRKHPAQVGELAERTRHNGAADAVAGVRNLLMDLGDQAGRVKFMIRDAASWHRPSPGAPEGSQPLARTQDCDCGNRHAGATGTTRADLAYARHLLADLRSLAGSARGLTAPGPGRAALFVPADVSRRSRDPL
jgi:hypothetical protein